MSDIVERLRATLTDKDNMPRMKSEQWLPVGLAVEAADEIRQLRRELDNSLRTDSELRALLAAIFKITSQPEVAALADQGKG